MSATKRYTVSATFLFHGYPDYWGGNSRRWDDDAGCLFATYGPDTTVRELINEWVNDFNNGGDCDSFPEDVTADDVRAALLAMLSAEGRANYKSGALSEFADSNGGELAARQLVEEGECPVAIVLLECVADDD